MKKHTTAVLSAMVTGMDDRDDPQDYITLEAMNGLSKILAEVWNYPICNVRIKGIEPALYYQTHTLCLQVEEDSVRAILLNISLRIRPCFEKDKVDQTLIVLRWCVMTLL